MTAILSIQNNTIYFEKFVRQQLKTQESEARADLKGREAEMREVKAQKTMNDRIVEELRPLCEGLYSSSLDPVSYEPILDPFIFICGHTFNRNTILGIIHHQNLDLHRGNIKCPSCRTICEIQKLYPSIPLEEMSEKTKKIHQLLNKTE